MKKIIYIVLSVLTVSTATLYGQKPQRTPQDIASKQTEILVRELQIHDSLIRDTLYRMHLKYAILRQSNNTRADAMQYMQEMNAELQQILTPEQYQQFMSQQVNHEHRSPRPQHNRIIFTPCDTLMSPPPPPHPNGEAPHMPPPPPPHQ